MPFNVAQNDSTYESFRNSTALRDAWREIRAKGIWGKADLSQWGNSRWGQRHGADPRREKLCAWKMYD